MNNSCRKRKREKCSTFLVFYKLYSEPIRSINYYSDQLTIFIVVVEKVPIETFSRQVFSSIYFLRGNKYIHCRGRIRTKSI